MKKCWILLVLVLCLSGCGDRETFETVGDELLQPVMAQMAQVSLALPEEALVSVIRNEDGGALYFCGNYTAAVQTLESGDLSRTVRTVSGYDAEALSILETKQQEMKRYEWVWTAAGEKGDQICRAAVLDDGSYHYCLTVTADAADAGKLETQWNSLFDSFTLG